jgi:DNA mismatch repair protein MutS2
VEEALERMVYQLDRAAVVGAGKLVVVHGLGSGALRDAIRAHLASSPYVEEFRAGSAEEGGEGVTLVRLRD